MANIEVDWQEDPEPVQIQSGVSSRDKHQNNIKKDSSNESKNLQPQSSNEESSGDHVAASNQSSFSIVKKKVMSVDWLIYKAKKEIFGELPPIAKDFYIEDPEVSSMSPNQAAQWRRPNFDIKVRRASQTTPKEERQAPSVLILVPTREFALQMNKEVFNYKYKNIKSVCLYGQTQSNQDMKVDLKGVDIVIATPDCFRHAVYASRLQAKNFSFIVLDEADKLLVSLYDRRPSHQTVMISATWSLALMQQVQLYMNEPIRINVGSLDLAAAHTNTQHLMFVEFEASEKILLTFTANMKRGHKVIIFCNSKASSTHLYPALKEMSIFPRFLSSDMDQDDRQAALQEVLDSFVNTLIQILLLGGFI